MKNINKPLVFILAAACSFLLVLSFVAAIAEEEGTLGTNIIWIGFAKIFYILRFPTHTLFWFLVAEGGPLLFLADLY